MVTIGEDEQKLSKKKSVRYIWYLLRWIAKVLGMDYYLLKYRYVSLTLLRSEYLYIKIHKFNYVKQTSYSLFLYYYYYFIKENYFVSKEINFE